MKKDQFVHNVLENHHFFILMSALLAILLLAPLVLSSTHPGLILHGAFDTVVFFATYVILFTIYSLSHNLFSCVIAAGLGISFLFLDLASLYYDSVWIMVIGQTFCILFLLFAIFYIGKIFVRKGSRVTANIIYGVITIYVFAGIAFSRLYWIIHIIQGKSFKGLTVTDGNDFYPMHLAVQDQFDLLYFSFTSLATLGIGDIAPITNLVKSLMILEAVFGQLFVAITIAKIVTIWAAHEERKF